MRCRLLPLGALLLAAPLAGAEVRIPECLLNFRVGPEQHLLVVEKSSHRLLVFSNYADQPVESFRVTTGRVPGQKREEGDQKTPEGIYTFESILTGDQLPKSDDYGDKAFTLSYPNPLDRLHRRNGGGIWLHGAHDPDKTTVPNNSRGCVVLNNNDLMRVSKYIFLRRTMICIYDRIVYDTVAGVRQRRERFLDQLRQWKESWEGKDVERYIGFYSPSFRYRSMDLTQFRRYKQQLNSQYEFIRVFLGGIQLFGYGNSRVACFDQLYLSDQNQFHSAKIQYWQEESGRLRIVDETTRSLPPAERVEVSPGNFLAVEEFRRQTRRLLSAGVVAGGPASFRPAAVRLERIDVEAARVRLLVQASGLEPGARLIPVLRLAAAAGASFRTLAGIGLDNGIPRDFAASLPLANGANRVDLTKERADEVLSLTLYVAGADSHMRQISTYIVKR